MATETTPTTDRDTRFMAATPTPMVVAAPTELDTRDLVTTTLEDTPMAVTRMVVIITLVAMPVDTRTATP